MRIFKIAGAVVLMLLFIYLLYPRLVNWMLQMQRPVARPVPAAQAAGEFNPYAPIVVVPNDYQKPEAPAAETAEKQAEE